MKHGAQTSQQPAANLDFNVELKIERIVLDGVNLSHVEQQQMAASMQSELTRLLGLQAGQLHAQFALSAAVPHIAAAPVQLGGSGQAVDLGRQIAHSVHASLLKG